MKTKTLIVTPTWKWNGKPVESTEPMRFPVGKYKDPAVIGAAVLACLQDVANTNSDVEPTEVVISVTWELQRN